ncbi:hypothetical protein ACWCQW_25900 [Streptomyces mirabilis]
MAASARGEDAVESDSEDAVALGMARAGCVWHPSPPGGKLREGTERAAAAFIDEPLLSPERVLRDELDLPGAWFETIRMNVSAIAATLTDRTTVRQEWISRAV